MDKFISIRCSFLQRARLLVLLSHNKPRSFDDSMMFVYAPLSLAADCFHWALARVRTSLNFFLHAHLHASVYVLTFMSALQQQGKAHKPQ
jgi:hypothetical protein